MVSVLKTAIVAVVVSGVGAGAVLLYIDHKIDEATQAVVAPIEEKVGSVSETVESVASQVESTVDSLHDTADLARETFSDAESWWATAKTKTADSWVLTESRARAQMVSTQEDLSDLVTQGQEFVNDYLSEDKGA